MIVDSKGTNDPFVEISYAGQNKSSKKKEDLVNSVINKIIKKLILFIIQVFNEAIVFQDVSFDVNDVTTYPVFLLKVFDKNSIMSNTLIGFKYISVKYINKISFVILNSKQALLIRENLNLSNWIIHIIANNHQEMC